MLAGLNDAQFDVVSRAKQRVAFGKDMSVGSSELRS